RGGASRRDEHDQNQWEKAGEFHGRMVSRELPKPKKISRGPPRPRSRPARLREPERTADGLRRQAVQARGRRAADLGRGREGRGQDSEDREAVRRSTARGLPRQDRRPADARGGPEGWRARLPVPRPARSDLERVRDAERQDLRPY